MLEERCRWRQYWLQTSRENLVEAMVKAVAGGVPRTSDSSRARICPLIIYVRYTPLRGYEW
jgi:hypothetical protein